MLSYVLAVLVGISLGMLGSGGSILAVPILKYAAGLSAKEAVATSLATVGSVAFVGSLIAWREGRVAWKAGALFAVVATAGTVLGVKIATALSDKVQMGIFVAVMVYAVVRMLKQDDAEESATEQESRVSAVLKALAVGVLTGVVGVGGGFLIVPALVTLFRLSMKTATGTSLVVICVNSLIGAIAYSGTVSLDWTFTAYFSGAAIIGLVAGNLWAQKISEDRLKKIFAGLVAVVCLYTAAQEFYFL